MLSGELDLHFEHGEPTRLRAGERALISSHRPHAYVAPSPEGATLLVVLMPPSQAPAKPLSP
ncbi:cupin domain-containing protein [Burkholderia sp. AU30280]|uniref:cupin domain-containing protein n=1 Tax=Burkholderia sp. AU30280 TaxID=2879628 RepID=UPI001CF4AB05|nr:cupin domain-containing protein [Burkholderia sp. AU30280]